MFYVQVDGMCPRFCILRIRIYPEWMDGCVDGKGYGGDYQRLDSTQLEEEEKKNRKTNATQQNTNAADYVVSFLLLTSTHFVQSLSHSLSLGSLSLHRMRIRHVC